MGKIITHNGVFHADEVFAVALIKRYCRSAKNFSVLRTRDMSVISDGDYVVDVGGVELVQRRGTRHEGGS